MPRRPLLGLLLLATVAALAALAVPEAAARGGSVVDENLLAKGHKALRRAEVAWFEKDTQNAAYFGRQAERIFHDVLVQSPSNRQAALLGGQAATLAGNLRGAGDWLVRFQRISPTGEGDPELHYLRAFVALLGHSRPKMAMTSLQRMYSLNARVRPIERDNLWLLALGDLGRLYLESGKEEEASRQFATGARIARRLGDVRKERLMLANLGAAYMRGTRYIEAAEVFSGLATLEPKNPLWHWRYGMALANQSKFGDAVKIYRKVIELRKAGYRSGAEDELREVKMRLGNCLRHLAARQRDPKARAKFIQDASDNLTAYIELAPKDARGHKWMGALLYENLDKPYEALVYFEKSFELDPVCDDALRRMIQILSRYPAPEGRDPATWKTRLEAMQRDLDENAKSRKDTQKKREKKDGSTGCV